MNELENIIEVSNLLHELSLKIPEGSEQTFDVNGMKFTLKKEEGVIKLISEENDSNDSNDFDDSDIKEIIKEYKENIDSLDDDVFLEVVEELGKVIDLNYFNELLDAKEFDKKSASDVKEYIEISADIIASKLQSKIYDLVTLYEKF